MRGQAGAVYWLNCWEPARRLGRASAMPKYEPYCTKALSTGALSDVQRFIEKLD